MSRAFKYLREKVFDPGETIREGNFFGLRSEVTSVKLRHLRRRLHRSRSQIKEGGLQDSKR